MSNVYIRSQNREKLYIFGISFNSLQYEEQHDYNGKLYACTGKWNGRSRDSVPERSGLYAAVRD